jgi:cystathionine beta-synthase
MSGRVKASDPVTKALYPQFRQVSVATTLAELARMFDRDHFALVVQTQRTYRGMGSPKGQAVTEKSVIVGVVSRIDLLKYITTHTPDGALSPSAASPHSPTAANH